MVDNYEKGTRSYTMSRVKGRDTKPEMLVRKALYASGFRFRKNDRRYLGCPDIVLPKYKTMIFVNGCFWHGHINCKRSHMPKSNTDYWENKIGRNVQRDNSNHETLKNAGWNVIVIWECELVRNLFESRIKQLIVQIRGF